MSTHRAPRQRPTFELRPSRMPAWAAAVIAVASVAAAAVLTWHWY